MDLFGNYTALITPFTAAKNIDFPTLENLVNRQLDGKTQGIVALGSTAEAASLNSFEKHKIMETICSATYKKVPIIAGVNSFSLDDALLQSYQRFLDGADALLISPPPYIKPTQKGLLNYFTSLADKSYIPIILYNIPSRTGTSISVDIISTLSKHPNIIGIKEASGDLNYAISLADNIDEPNFSILSGNDNLLLPLLSIGAKGIISVVGNIDPQICCKPIQDFYSNNIIEAQKLYNKYTKLINVLSLESNPIPIKYIMYKLNLIKPYYREPLCMPSKNTKAKISNILSTFPPIINL